MFERAGLSLEVAERKRARLFAEMHRHGVVLVSGSDAGIEVNKPHGILPRSVAALLISDVPAVSALASATSVAARQAGLSGHKGRLRAGHDADLLLVDGDPLTDVGALTGLPQMMGTRSCRIWALSRGNTGCGRRGSCYYTPRRREGYAGGQSLVVNSK